MCFNGLSSEGAMEKLLGEGFLLTAGGHVSDVAGFVFGAREDGAHLAFDRVAI